MKNPFGALTLAVLSAVLAIAALPAQAQTETVLYSFASQPGDGFNPVADLVFGKKGNLYSTTLYGGANNVGTVFELTAAGTEKVLYSFGSQPGDGTYPYAGLVFDKEGNLYGTTYSGGAHNKGTVFELTAAGTEKVLYSFGSQPGDGYNPYSGLVFDKEGNLYGTTYIGGADGYGTVFELTAAGTEIVLYSFGSQPGDGLYPYAGLVFDKKGNLYGTTNIGGADDLGTVFEVTAAGTEKVLYSFEGLPDGFYPYAGLVFDKDGNLYGTTSAGGTKSGPVQYGMVFELTAAGTEKVLYSFGSQPDGSDPYAGLVLGKNGKLYGTTVNGGSVDVGTVFEVIP